jgi:hypothetical protein
MISGQRQFPIHQLPQARWFVGSFSLLAPSERLFQNDLGRK